MKLAIVTACSSDWVPMACATLLSCARNRTIAAENFIIMPEGSSASSAHILRAASALTGEPVRAIELDKQIVSGLKTGKYHETAVYRLAMDIVIDHRYDRVLYLDSDLLVLKSLDDFLACDLQDYSAAAVADFGVLPGFSSSLADRARASAGIALDQKYLNSGVVLFSWKQSLSAQVFSRARELVAVRDFKFPDQDSLNIVLRGRWGEANPKYNVQAPARSIIEATVVHFTRKPKPWDADCAEQDLIYRGLYASLFSELGVGHLLPRRQLPRQNSLSWVGFQSALKNLELAFRPARRRRKRESKELRDRLERELEKFILHYAQSFLVESDAVQERQDAQ